MLKRTATPPPAEPGALDAFPDLAEVLLEHKDLARTGTLTDETLREAATRCAARGQRAVLVWDVLSHDRDLLSHAAYVRTLPLHLFAAIRAQDVGVAAYVRSAFPELPLQLVLETGNHNLVGVQAWVRALSPERVVLSNELPVDQIRTIAAAIGVETEVAALGRILIFYSPRKLVEAVEGPGYETVRQRYARELESGKTFPIVENRHGTFMYYEKDLNLLPWYSELAQSGVTWARFDFKFFEAGLVAAVAADLAAPSGSRTGVQPYLSTRQTRGFFKSNRTDKQLDRLKNPHLMVREDVPLLGTALESAKKEGYTVLETKGLLRVGDLLDYVIPEGEHLTHEVAWIRDPNGNKHQQTDQPGLWLIDHVKKASAGTHFYHQQPRD